MYLNDYSVQVIPGNEIPGGYVEMQDGQHYNIRLRNNNSVRCDACVEIDGIEVGTWRLGAHESRTYETPGDNNVEERFTFFKLGTRDGRPAGLDGSNRDLGLIRVTFTPEKQMEPMWSAQVTYRGEPVAKGLSYDIETYPPVTMNSSGLGGSANSVGNTRSVGTTRGLSAGGTGLSGHSNQKFINVRRLDYDYSRQTVINLRLACKNGIKPLTSLSSPVPPRI